MRKNTLIVAALLTAVSMNAQEKRYWSGTDQDAPAIWSTTAQNWVYDAFGMGDPTFFMPTGWSQGSEAVFNGDGVAEEGANEAVTVTGEIEVSSIQVSGDRNYVLSKGEAGVLTGAGALVKTGSGNFILDVENKLVGGTIISEGKVVMQKQSSPNVFGEKIVLDGGAANFAVTSASTYPLVTVPVEIAEGKTGIIELSRYSQWKSPLKGSSDLIIRAGGERCMLGSNKAGGDAHVIDWSEFTGNVTIEPCVLDGVTPGYYGLMLTAAKTFSEDDFLSTEGVDSVFWDKTLTLKSGAGIAAVSGVRCFEIGELQAEDETSFLAGYGSGNSDSPKIYYRIGGKGTDVVFPGSFRDAGSKGYNYFGIIKAGKGTYTFTSTKSYTTAFRGAHVVEGRLLVNIPVTDETTALGRGSKMNALTVYPNGTGGGNGRITGKVHINGGKFEIGCDGIGEIVLGDTLTGTTNSFLSVTDGGSVIFELADAKSYDKLTAESGASFGGNKIVVKMTNGVYEIKDGDKFTIFTSEKAKAEGDTYEIVYEGIPAGVTLTHAEEEILEGEAVVGYKIVLTAAGSASGGSGVKGESIADAISVFPNPSAGEFIVEGADMKSIEVYSAQGVLVNYQVANAASTTIDLTGMAKGYYLAKIETTEGTVVKKLVIR